MTDRRVNLSRAEAALREALRGELKPDEPMSRHTSIGVGGVARYFAQPRTPIQVARLLARASEHGVPYVPIGKGSNLIVRDGGYEGLVIKMSTHLAKVKVNLRTVTADGGAAFAVMSRKMTRAGRTGLEFGIGIPGTVGGAVRMNAGAFGGEVKDVLTRVRIAERDGTTRSIRAADIGFAYRHSDLPRGSVVLSATFRCAPGEVRKDVFERSIGRKHTQPIDERSFGSTFTNPSGGYAAEMIEGCGLKGHRIGGAEISKKHANFIINVDGTATAADVEGLIDLMREAVQRRYGVTLKTEVVVIGNR